MRKAMRRMRILDIIQSADPPQPWTLGDNIPWNDPEFSERMLREHLSPEHDLASRRIELIERHTRWIHDHVLKSKTARILDLCCGPGLYGVRLAARGHEYYGIDYSPASIAYANKHNAAQQRCTYIEGDVRQTDYGDGHDLAMLIYGEFNVFNRANAGEILRKAHAALNSGGLLLLEPHAYDTVASIGAAEPSWQALESGLFSTAPHLYLKRSDWDDKHHAATVQFFIVDAETSEVRRWAVSYQAYTDRQYSELLAEFGFEIVERGATLTGEALETESPLMTILARKSRG